MGVVDKDLASSEVFGATNYTPLRAGDDQLKTEEVTVDAGVLAKYTVLGKITASGKVVQINPAGVDGSQIAYGVLTQAVDASVADVRVAAYVAGCFNDPALVWPVNAAYDSLVKRQAAFARTPIRIGTIRL